VEPLDVDRKCLVQDRHLLVSVKKNAVLHDVDEDLLALQMCLLVVAQGDVLVVDLFELHQSQVRPAPNSYRSAKATKDLRLVAQDMFGDASNGAA